MMQQINPGLMKVLAAQSQINPMTPEGAPSVAANVLAQAGQAPGIAAIGQQAQEALPSMMRNAQDDQAKQMLEAAQRASQPAGIAGLNIPMGQFADGGVVGFAEGGQPKRAYERLLDWLQSVDEESKKARWKSASLQEETPQPMVPMIPNKGLEEPAATNLSVLPSAGYNFPSSILQAPRAERRESAPSAATRTSQPAGVAGLPAGRTALPGEELYAQARREFLNQMPPDQRSLQERRAQEDEYLRSLGLPTSLRPAEEARLKQMEEFDAQTRAQIAKQNKDAMQGAWMSGILKPAQNLARMFSGAAEGMLGEEGKQREQAVRDAALQRQQMMAANAVRTKLDEADILRARGDIDGYNKAMEEARKFENALSAGLASLSSGQAKDVVDFEQAKALERLKQSGAERAANRASEFERLYNRLFPGEPMTLDKVEQVKRAMSPTAANQEMSIELRALQNEEQQLLKRLEATMLPDQRKPIEARLDRIIERRLKLMGGEPSPSAAPSGTVDTTNPLLK